MTPLPGSSTNPKEDAMSDGSVAAISEYPAMNTNQWIAHVDQARSLDDLLLRGAWHGYTEADSAPPMRGTYYLVRWAIPTVAVSHDDPAEALRLARLIEEAVGAP